MVLIEQILAYETRLQKQGNKRESVVFKFFRSSTQRQSAVSRD